MRLIKTASLEMEQFYDDTKIPEYAILSHTWGDEEATFEDMKSTSASVLSSKAGFAKIKACCIQAARDGYEYVWVDTCCIDKSSSAELTEAINSMFRWYQDSSRCFAYLADVPGNLDPDDLSVAFARSRWFTRGWTLQELLAPRNVIFYAQDWTEIGDRARLGKEITKITSIHQEILDGLRHVSTASIAERMSWASKRQTTRIEDIAYCLLGIFNINMPMLYGEGKRAFIRLQEEIIKDSDDQSIFAWDSDHLHLPDYRGILAPSPSLFANSAGFVPKAVGNRATQMPYSITNKGLQIQLPSLFNATEDVRIAIIGCINGSDPNMYVGIKLKRVDAPYNLFERVAQTRVKQVCPEDFAATKTSMIYIRKADFFGSNLP